MSAWLSQWMLHPLLFVGGVSLVFVPLVIYLLNKRRFRVIDWSAMNFLVEAEQRNWHRVRLEEWLLLVLRCVLVLFVGLLVARPFFSTRSAGELFDEVPLEWIILLDDSPSMSADLGQASPFSEAKSQIVGLVKDLEKRGLGDSLTLVLTSRPSWPVFNDRSINAQTISAVIADVNALQQSDLRCRWERVCSECLAAINLNTNKLNRVVYLLTDLRRSDWNAEDVVDADSNAASGPKELSKLDSVFESLRVLSLETKGCFLADLGSDVVANLAVSEIVSEDKLILAGSSSRFTVKVRNHGLQTLHDVPIQFSAGNSVPLTATVPTILGGGTASVPFSYQFLGIEDDASPIAVEVWAKVNAPSASDAVAIDNVRYFATRVRSTLSALIVDGDSSTDVSESESFYLQRALNPPGSIGSGIQVDVVSDSEFEFRSLAPYEVVFFCNVYRLSATRVASLRTWIEGGGGLVVFPSAQADEQFYNELLFAGGEGLLPRRLVGIVGGEDRQRFGGVSIAQVDHPAVRIFQGEAAALLDFPKIFRWWQLDEPRDVDNSGTVVLRLTDAERTPAFVERAVGKGRVAQFCFGADADWTDWPHQPSYVILLQELTRFLAQPTVDRSSLIVGEPIRQSIDISMFRAEAIITNPQGVSIARQSMPDNATGIDSTTAKWCVEFDDTSSRGFYRAVVAKPDGQATTMLFAANLHAADSDLNRVDRKLLEAALEGSNVRVVGQDNLFSQSVGGRAGEMWYWVLLVLVSLLFVEQFLAWKLGRAG